MDFSIMVDAMVHAGCSPGQIAAVVKACSAAGRQAEEERRAKNRVSNADRQRRYRNAHNGVTQRDNALCDVTPRDPSPSPDPQRDNSNPLTPTPTIAALSSAGALTAVDIRKIENRLRSAARLEESPSPALLDLSPILGLIDAGLDFETEILPVVRSKARPGIGSWNFFVKPCHDSRASRNAAANAHGHASARAPPKQTEKRNPAFAAYEEMVQDERDSRG